MKNKRILFFTKILSVIFIIGTVISFFIVYQDLKGSITYNFMLGYTFFSFFIIVYIPVIVIMNLKIFKWIEVKNAIIKFIILFILFVTMNYGLDYMFRPERKDLFRASSTALGLACGISFIDLIFLKNKKNY